MFLQGTPGSCQEDALILYFEGLRDVLVLGSF